MEAFIGSWKLVNSTNFDKYLDGLGLTPAMKNYGMNMTSVIIFSQDGDNIVKKTKMYGTVDRTVKLSFKLDEEFDELSTDYRACKTVFNLEEGKLVQLQKWDGRESTIIREIQEGRMITTFILGDVVSVRTHERT